MPELSNKERALIDAAMYGPMAIMGAIGKQAPPWMRLISLGIGVGITARAIFTLMEADKPKPQEMAGLGCGGMCQCRNCQNPRM